MERFKRIMMDLADILNAWRVIPRAMAAMYGLMVYKLFVWYTSIPTHIEEKCDNGFLNTLLANDINIDKAMEMACTVAGTVGGPTTQQTSFVTIIIGLSSAIFAFYVGSGSGDGKPLRFDNLLNKKTKTVSECKCKKGVELE